MTSHGGASASGGAAASGGVAATGGVIPTGGTGGTTAAGGTMAGGGSAGGTQPMTATGGTAIGGATLTGGATATGGAGSCNYPACYSQLVSGCTLVGTCVEQRVAMCGDSPCPQPLGSPPTSIIADRCYASGVTAAEVTDTTSTDMVTTVKKSGTECYSFETQYSASTATTLPMVLKNSAGTAIATYVIDSNDGTATITCSGGSPVVVSLDCGSPLPDGSTVECTTGTCTP